MEESPVDLSGIVWIDDRRPRRSGVDPAHHAQLADRDRVEAERRVFAGPRDSLGEAREHAGESVRGALALIGRLVHDLKPVPLVRHHSEVRHFAWQPFEDLVESIGRSGPIETRVGRVRLRCGSGRMRDDPPRFEADGRLHLPASRPDLLVSLAIEPWWRNRSAVTLRIRPSHRLRYPRRYFDAAHGVVSELTSAPAATPRG